MTAKEYLSQYSRLTEKIRQIDENIEILSAEIDSISVNLDGMPRGTKTSNRTEKLAIKLAGMRDEQIRTKEKAWKKRDEIQKVIEAVEDPVRARLLYDRYILCWRWDMIAEDIHHDSVYTRTQLHSKALKDVSQCIMQGVI